MYMYIYVYIYIYLRVYICVCTYMYTHHPSHLAPQLHQRLLEMRKIDLFEPLGQS